MCLDDDSKDNQMTKHSEQSKEQAPIDKAIAAELIALTPEFWTAATLIVRKDREPGGVARIAHNISSQQGHREIITPDDVLYGITNDLFELFNKYGRDLRRVTYNVTMSAEGQWQMKEDYGYDEESIRKQGWPDGV